MDSFKDRLAELTDLMEEFGLNEAELAGEGWRIAFKKGGTVQVQDHASDVEHQSEHPAEVAPPVMVGTAITSPMTGIFYSTPSPTSPAFVKEGESVTAGQVVALIEAMKVFNEITATMSGTVLKIVAENGAIVNPGDTLIMIG